jgi:hypothetical protein
MICDSCSRQGKEMVSIYDESNCPHQVGMPDEDNKITTVLINRVGDYFEVSNVPVPAQRAASVDRKSLDKTKEFDTINNESIVGDSIVSLEDKEKLTRIEDSQADNVVDQAKEPADVTGNETEQKEGCSDDEEMEDEEMSEKEAEVVSGTEEKSVETPAENSDETSLKEVVSALSTICQDLKEASQKFAESVTSITKVMETKITSLEADVQEQKELTNAIAEEVSKALNESEEDSRREGLYSKSLVESNMTKSTRNLIQGFLGGK